MMTIVEAIKTVMLNKGSPLTAREAYDLIVQQQLYSFRAQNPGHVVLMQIRRHCVGLDFPSSAPTKHFELHGENRFFPLTKPLRQGKSAKARPSSKPKNIPTPASDTVLPTVEKDLWKLHSQYISLFRQSMIQELRTLTPQGFEEFSQELLTAYGFENVCVTNITGDGGIDGYGKLKVGLAHLNVAFQCKRWTKGNIQRPEIDKFRGASQGDYEQGIFFSTTSFSTGAIGASIKRGAIPIVLIDGQAIVDLMIERKLRVESTVMEIPTFAL